MQAAPRGFTRKGKMRIPFLTAWIEGIKAKAYRRGYDTGYAMGNEELVVFSGGIANGKVMPVRKTIKEMRFPAMVPSPAMETLGSYFGSDSFEIRDVRYHRTDKTLEVQVSVPVFAGVTA